MLGEAERRERFGYALQRALNARHMSERELARRLGGIDPRKVARWRTGKDLPDLYETIELARRLNVDEELFRNPPAVPEPPPEPYYPIEKYLLDAVGEGARRGSTGPDRDDEDDDGPDERPARPRRKGR